MLVNGGILLHWKFKYLQNVFYLEIFIFTSLKIF